MSLDEHEIDRRLARLHTAAEAATANLIELEDLGTLSLLRAGDYSGVSRVPIETALADITALNFHYSCFMAFVRDIDEIRSAGRVTRERSRLLERLLITPSIPLPVTETEFESRDLFTPIERADQVTPDQLIEMMNNEFVAAKAVVLQVDKVWRELLPALANERGRLATIRSTAEALGERVPELRDLERRIDWCHAATATDPLGAASAVAAEIGPALDGLERRVRDVAASRHGLAGQLTVARQQLRAIVAAIEDSDRARADSRQSIVDPQGLLTVDHRYLDDERTGLIPWLDRLDDMQTDGRWRDAQAGLRRWTERADQVLTTAAEATKANRAPLARRDELRGMLSAYEVVARRDGAPAGADLARLHLAARENLFGEPTDLTLAATQVRRYQDAVRAREPF